MLTLAVLILVMLGAFAAQSGDSNALNAAGEKRGVKAYLGDFAGLLRNKGLMIVSLSSSFRTMTQAGLLTFLPGYLAYELG